MDGSFVGSGQGSVTGTSGRRKRKNTEEIPEWVKVSFLEFMVLLILWGFIYNSCKSL